MVKIVTHGYRTRNPPSLQIAHGTITSRSQVVPRLGPNGTRRCSYARPFSCRRREGAMLNLVHLARTLAALSRDLSVPCLGRLGSDPATMERPSDQQARPLIAA